MTKNGKIIISAVTVAVILFMGTFLVTRKIPAEAAATSQTIIDRLAERFNLKKDDVKSVFNEERQGQQQKMQAQMEARLNQAVKDGVINADQSQALLNKTTEVQEKQNQIRDEMQKWVEESGIDFEKLAPYRVGFGFGFGGKGFGHGRHFADF